MKRKTGLIQRLHESFATSIEGEQSFSNIADPEERDEAQKELKQTLNSIIRKERDDNLKLLESNTKFIKELAEENEKLKIELEIVYEQVVNNKCLLEETNNKLYEAQNELRKSEFSIIRSEIKNLKKKIVEKDSIIRNYEEELSRTPRVTEFIMDSEVVSQLKSELEGIREELNQEKQKNLQLIDSQSNLFRRI